jgi:hypothetical protein
MGAGASAAAVEKAQDSAPPPPPPINSSETDQMILAALDRYSERAAALENKLAGYPKLSEREDVSFADVVDGSAAWTRARDRNVSVGAALDCFVGRLDEIDAALEGPTEQMSVLAALQSADGSWKDAHEQLVAQVELKAILKLQAWVRGWQVRARYQVVTAPMVSLAISLPSWAAASAQGLPKRLQMKSSMSCPGMGASWSGTDGLTAHCKVVATVPRTAAGGPLQNARALRGNVALVDRGGASFTDKAMALSEAGAIGVIFVNDSDALVAPQGTAGATRKLLREDKGIPAMCISNSAGARLRSMLQMIDDIAKSLPPRPAAMGRSGGNQSRRWGTPAADSSVDISWSVLPFDWAARRIQKEWRRRVRNRNRTAGTRSAAATEATATPAVAVRKWGRRDDWQDLHHR